MNVANELICQIIVNPLEQLQNEHAYVTIY
jgi:hypothetical protein